MKRLWFHHVLTAIACVYIAVFLYAAAQRLAVPSTLNPAEASVLDHVKRISNADQTSVQDPYNPLYYYLCALFVKLATLFNPKFQLTLTAMRQFALAGTAGCAWMLYRSIKRETRSIWLAWIGVGLFAAGSKALDSYYDISQRETWVLFLLLAGAYCIGYSESPLRDTIGMLFFITAFWMKPLTLVFIIGGLAFLAWRNIKTGADLANVMPAFLAAFLFGPALYFLIPGPERITLNWDPQGTGQFATWLARHFVVLAAFAGAGLQLSLERGRPMSVWIFLLPTAFVGAMLETMTTGYEISGLIPFAGWMILTGLLAVPRLERNVPWMRRLHFTEIALCLSFLALA